ncbi:MAG: hypothetical protein OXE98_03645 [Hyphomicrobiales bacterium]|nr:hypothetical protein [Hyphomicrobiales bacterium]MCY4052955.1 hypothetical protein [Hyphomicrobiales bacterium]
MLRIFLPCLVAAASVMLAAMSATDEASGEGFPLLSDVPERPAQVSRSVRENERDYHAQVEEMEAERRKMLNRLEQLRPVAVQEGE